MEPYEIIQDGCCVQLTDIESVIEVKKKVQQRVITIEKELKEEKEELKKLKTFLKINCDHNIVTDYIDLLEGYKEGVFIRYCDKCELNFN